MNDKEITHMMRQMLTNYETKIRPNYTGIVPFYQKYLIF